MGYTLTSEATDESLKLSSGEWEMLLRLAASPGGWEQQQDRDYTRGRIDSEEASRMAESVKGMLPYVSSERTAQENEETPRTRQGLRKTLGYEETPRSFFGDPRRRYKAESFVRLASAGVFEVIPDS